jgi:GMP synthase (glutamine-hydrolysing)
MRMRKVLLYKTGETDPTLVTDIGDYESWFGRVLGDRCALEVHRAFERPRHRLSGYDGLVLTGSPRSLVEPEPWMDDAAAFVREADGVGVPVLGVCFGHQLIGWAYGGRVRMNPNGWEIGSCEVALTDDGARDALFAGVPARLRVNESHRDEVGALGPATRRLAGGTHTETQALAVGDHVRGVQFHPEMNGAVIRRLIEHRRQLLTVDAAERARAFSCDRAIADACDTPDAERVLRNFVDHFIKAA